MWEKIKKKIIQSRFQILMFGKMSEKFNGPFGHTSISVQTIRIF